MQSFYPGVTMLWIPTHWLPLEKDQCNRIKRSGVLTSKIGCASRRLGNLGLQAIDMNKYFRAFLDYKFNRSKYREGVAKNMQASFNSFVGMYVILSTGYAIKCA